MERNLICSQCGQKVEQLFDVVGLGRDICEGCKDDFIDDHPNMEELIAEAEYREDR